MVNNGKIQYQLIRSNRRTVEISVRNGDVLVRCPRRMPLSEVQAFVEQKGGWIARHMEKQRQQQRVSPQRQYTEGGMFPLLGSEYPLHLSNHFAFDGRICILSGQTPAAVREGLAAFYYHMAQGHIGGRVRHYLPILGIGSDKVDILSIRYDEYKSQWGSCSAKNKLSFNIRLMLYDERVVDYVVVHELAHILHRNHSAAFWSEVERVLPDYKQLRKELKQDISF